MLTVTLTKEETKLLCDGLVQIKLACESHLRRSMSDDEFWQSKLRATVALIEKLQK